MVNQTCPLVKLHSSDTDQPIVLWTHQTLLTDQDTTNTVDTTNTHRERPDTTETHHRERDQDHRHNTIVCQIDFAICKGISPQQCGHLIHLVARWGVNQITWDRKWLIRCSCMRASQHQLSNFHLNQECFDISSSLIAVQTEHNQLSTGPFRFIAAAKGSHEMTHHFHINGHFKCHIMEL